MDARSRRRDRLVLRRSRQNGGGVWALTDWRKNQDNRRADGPCNGSARVTSRGRGKADWQILFGVVLEKLE
jgi:hypothetical protein